MTNTSDQVLIILPDGPVAFDGKHFRYSKGERLYLDNLAKKFKEIHLATFVVNKGEQFYDSLIHSKFESDNIIIKELPKPIFREPGVLGKAFQFLLVFFRLILLTRKADLGYLFLPSYPSAMAWVSLKLWRKPHIVYGADDWVQASESMFKWQDKKNSSLYKIYAKLNFYMEKNIVSSALFSVAAGGQLIEKYKNYGCHSYATSPRMTLSSSDIYNRDDTCNGKIINIVNVGSLIHDKAQHILIEAFAIASNKYPNLKLKIIGEGPEKNNLIRIAKKLNVENKIIFQGYVQEESILYEHLRNADIFALSSITEGFPRVLYEAMCMRLPIVTTDVGGIPYLLINGENALVVKSGDVEELARSLMLVIENSDLRKGIIKKANRTIDGIFKRMDGGQIAKLLSKHSIS